MAWMIITKLWLASGKHADKKKYITIHSTNLNYIYHSFLVYYLNKYLLSKNKFNGETYSILQLLNIARIIDWKLKQIMQYTISSIQIQTGWFSDPGLFMLTFDCIFLISRRSYPDPINLNSDPWHRVTMRHTIVFKVLTI